MNERLETPARQPGPPAAPPTARPAGRGPFSVAAWRRGGRVGPLLVLAAASGVLGSDLFTADRVTPLVQITAFRPVLAPAAAILGLLAVLVGLPRIGAALLAPALVATTVLLPRAVPDPPSAAESTTGAGGGRKLTVLTINLKHGQADTDRLLALVSEVRPDVLALPEADSGWVPRVGPRVRALGYSGPPEAPEPTATTVLYLHNDLGRPQLTTLIESWFGAVEARAPGLGPVRVIGAHPPPPRPVLIPAWRAGLAPLRGWCDGSTIVLGDLNSTLDHSRLRRMGPGCVDAAERTGEGLVATWPSTWPRWAGVQIDHVLVPPSVRVERVTVHDLPGTDHRAVSAVLRLPGPAAP
jgi:endonuclease/exonuclease/phosphatase (EEP) superfamily protein YafD